MIQFPSKTVIKNRGKIGKFLPKETLYARCSFSAKEEDQMVADIERITITHSFKTETLSLDDGKSIHEILLFEVELKKRKYHSRLFEKMAQTISNPILFLLRYQEEIQLALYEQRWHYAEWIREETAQLEFKGPTLDELWNGFVVQIASLRNVPGEAIGEKLENKRQWDQLKRKIDQIQKKIARECQPRRKFDLHNECQALIRQLEEIKKSQD